MKESNTTCRILFNGGLTINPDGRILLCCASVKKELAHISEIDNLLDFYNSSLLNEIRETMKSGSLPKEWCYSCIRKRKEGQSAPIDDWVKSVLDWTDSDSDSYKMRFLEFAPSNICNQTCAMCGSVYSSKWVEWDKEAIDSGLTFRQDEDSLNRTGYNKVWSMNDKDIQKIYDVLDTVEYIHLKGGEPFADKRNYEIIKYCSTLEKQPVIFATTNFANIPDKVMDLVCNYKYLRFSVSIDGTGKLYEWVRGSSYKQTIDNCKMYMASTGISPNVSCTPTLYTLYSLDKYLLEMRDIGFQKIQFNWCSTPSYTSVEAEPEIDYYNDKYKKFLSTFGGVMLGRPEYLYTRKHKKIDSNIVRQWIEFLNKKRGFDIRDIVPELKKF